jgi:hypothetical protein
MTSNVYYGVPGGLVLVPGTYHVFGNNGTTPYNGSVDSGSDTALNSDLAANPPISAAILYQDLTTASDHLPVVADYIIPIPLPPFALGNPLFSAAGSLQFAVTNADGTPVTPAQLSQFGIYATTNLALALTNWTALTNVFSLSNGVLQFTDSNSPIAPQRFYRAVESP